MVTRRRASKFLWHGERAHREFGVTLATISYICLDDSGFKATITSSEAQLPCDLEDNVAFSFACIVEESLPPYLATLCCTLRSSRFSTVTHACTCLLLCGENLPSQY